MVVRNGLHRGRRAQQREDLVFDLPRNVEQPALVFLPANNPAQLLDAALFNLWPLISPRRAFVIDRGGDLLVTELRPERRSPALGPGRHSQQRVL